jgi:plastocyanin
MTIATRGRAHRPALRRRAAHRARWAIALALGVLLLSGAPARSTAQAAPAGQAAAQGNVVIRDFSFTPAEITVAVGGTVTWTNQDRVTHTATSPGAWDTGRLAPGQSATQRFDTPGVFEYFCAIHPRMRGRVIVEPVAQPSPTAPAPTATPTTEASPTVPPPPEPSPTPPGPALSEPSY